MAPLTRAHRRVIVVGVPQLIDLLSLTPEQLLSLAEQASRLARSRMEVAVVGAVVEEWTFAPRRAVLRDAKGDVLHLCSDGSYTHGSSTFGPDDRPAGGPWTVVELDVLDADARD